MYIVEVLIEHPVQSLDRSFSYISDTPVLKGVRVKVAFQNRHVIGYVEKCMETEKTLEELEAENGYAYKEIEEIIDETPLLNSELQQVASYLSQISLSPKIACLQTMLPMQLRPNSQKGVGKKYERYVQAVESMEFKMTPKQKACYEFIKNTHQPMKLKAVPFSSSIIKKLVDMHALDMIDVEIYRQHYETMPEKSNPLTLTPAQKKAVSGITEPLSFKTCLLFGVTGSGKTEVYLQAAQKVIDKKKTVMMLVPEIALTPMMVERFKERFGYRVAVLHSRLSQGEKYDEYRRILEKQVDIVVGARSAIFAPLENIGLIILDEEHDSSYKQESAPRYHTKDIARFRAKYHQCPLVFGSATPSIESFARAQKGVYELYELNQRINLQEMPKCYLVDMAKEVERRNYSLFSNLLKKKLIDCIRKGHQAILLLNRRGYAPYIQCKECGHVIKCPHCDVTLTYHKDSNTLKCHYCDYSQPMVSTCPECHSRYIQPMGYGTQKVEEMLYKEIPQAKVIRMDVDTTQRKGTHEKILKAFQNKEANILLGTQMIAKGLDFENVTFVGVLNADQTLNIPDFRASEKTFQLLCQVSGRSGRGQKKGEVVIQTYNPSHYALTCASKHDYLSFYKHEMQYRYYGNYPPFCRLIAIEIRGKEETVVSERAQAIVKYLKQQAENVHVLGPAPSLIYRLRDDYRYRILIKYKQSDALMEACQMIHQHYNKDKRQKISVVIDFNPYSNI